MVSEEIIFKYFFLLFFFFCFFVFWGVFFGILVSMETNENEQWTQNYMSDRRLLMKHLYIKVLSTYLQWLGSKCHFAIFAIICQWEL